MKAKRFLAIFLVCGLFFPLACRAAEEEADEVNPLLDMESAGVDSEQFVPMRKAGFGALFNDADLTIRSTYYGRSREANNGWRGGDRSAEEIHVNAFGQSVAVRSGYAWDIIGFDVTGQTNLGRGHGLSEVLYHDFQNNTDRSSVSLGQAAVKTRLGGPDLAWEARGGFTPISIGTLGTSGGLHSHAYRGMETRIIRGDFWLGYGWADRFRNEWDDTFRDMYPTWDQNRYDGRGRRINYIHSLGARYEFGLDKAGFIDAGLGEGRDYRRNAQLAVSAPFDLGCFGRLILTGYGLVGRYLDRGIYHPDGRELRTEYHVSGSARLERGDWTFMAGMGHTSAYNSWEMNFRLTSWGNSDNRNFIQTWGQLDDFVWDGQNVVKAGISNRIGNRIGLPGLSVGASYIYGWNADNRNGGGKVDGWEFDYQVEYKFGENSKLHGVALGAYAAHLRYNNNHFQGKRNRNDIKVILSYSKTFDHFLRPAR